MRKIIIIFLFLFLSFGVKAQKQDSISNPLCDKIIFKVEMGAYKNVPDSVESYIKNLDVDVERTRLHLQDVYVFKAGHFNCYREANNFKERLIRDGYKDAFIVACIQCNIRSLKKEIKEKECR